MRRLGLLTLWFCLTISTPVWGDEVVLTNGDKLTGKVGQIVGGKMTFNSPVLGEITIDMTNVKSFTTDEPADIRVKGGEPVKSPITEGDSSEITTAEGQTFTLTDVKVINPPPQRWTGHLVANGALVRGNTETEDLGVEALAVLRRDDERHNDRTTFDAQYNFGATGTGDDRITTRDNWSAGGKYDRFLDEKWYAYGTARVERDRIANLDLRVTPGVGVGYQWVETPDFNFNTEAGVSYVYEEYDPGGTNDFIALRLAYHLDKKLTERIALFHNVEYLPAFEDFGDFLVNADVGLRADLTDNFFGQFKVEWTHDSTPAPDRERNDYRYLLGVGWRF